MLAADERDPARARGAALYEKHDCARCHDPSRAEPGVVPVPLETTRIRSRHHIASLAAYLLSPTPPMPAFPLSERDRRDLAIFLLAGQPE
jgi:mono/diheme cytochrome c family protein